MVCNFATELFSELLRVESASRRTLISRRLGLVTKPAFFVTSGPSRLGRLANPLEMPLAERENEEEVCMSYVINYVIFQNDKCDLKVVKNFNLNRHFFVVITMIFVSLLKLFLPRFSGLFFLLSDPTFP